MFPTVTNFSFSFPLFFFIMRHISKEIHNNIVSLLDTGISSRKIGARLGVSRSTVDRVRAKARSGAQKSLGGRPDKLTATEKRRLVRMLTLGKADNATQLTRELKNTTNINVSTDTMRRALKEAGLKAVTKKKKPRLLPRHFRQRFDFALRHKH
jgi:transposase